MAKRWRVKMRIDKLSNFMQSEMRKREISGREFAKLVGVSHGTINRLLNFDSSKDKTVYPSLEVLLKLAKATQVDICQLLALIDPDSTSAISDPEAMILSEQIKNLPNSVRETIDNIVVGYTQKANKRDKS